MTKRWRCLFDQPDVARTAAGLLVTMLRRAGRCAGRRASYRPKADFVLHDSCMRLMSMLTARGSMGRR